MKQPILMPVLGKEDGDRWRLIGTYNGSRMYQEDWIYNFQYKDRNYRLIVPHGYDALDGASVPWALRPYLKMGGRDMPDEAWVPHDYLYACKGSTRNLQVHVPNIGWCSTKRLSRKAVDTIFYNELKKHGLARYKAPLAYLGLRLAFWKEWNV